MADRLLVNILVISNKEERNQKLKDFFDNNDIPKINLSNILNNSNSQIKHFVVIKNLFDYLLMQNDSNFYDLDLSSNKFGDNLIMLDELNKFIKNCVCIKSLNLSTNHLIDEHILILCEGISVNKSLKYVNLWNNEIKNLGLNYLKNNPNIMGRVKINSTSNHAQNDPAIISALFYFPKRDFQKASSQTNINSGAHSANSHANSDAIDDLDDLLEALKKESTHLNESPKNRSSVRSTASSPNISPTAIKPSTLGKQKCINSVHSSPVRENSSFIDEDEFEGHEASLQDSIKSKLPLPPLPSEIHKRITSHELNSAATHNVGMPRHSRISLEDRKSANEIMPLAREVSLSNKKTVNPSHTNTIFSVDHQTKAGEEQNTNRKKDDRHSRISLDDKSSVAILRP